MYGPNPSTFLCWPRYLKTGKIEKLLMFVLFLVLTSVFSPFSVVVG